MVGYKTRLAGTAGFSGAVSSCGKTGTGRIRLAMDGHSGGQSISVILSLGGALSWVKSILG